MHEVGRGVEEGEVRLVDGRVCGYLDLAEDILILFLDSSSDCLIQLTRRNLNILEAANLVGGDEGDPNT